jgi:hypothetical protein
VRAVAALMRGIIDYAGMFPPAGLPAAEAAQKYAGHAAHPQAWMLGSLVMSSAVIAQLDPATEQFGGTKRLTIVLAGDPEMQLDIALNHAAAGRRSGRQTAVEFPPQPAAAIEALAARLPGDVPAAFETPADDDMDARLDAIAAAGTAAKLRTGGITEAAFPPERQVARFLAGCAARRLRCKATAGLHHALTGEYPLTYEQGSSRARMYGFLNVCAAAALAARGANGDQIAAALVEVSRDAFRFTDAGWQWQGHSWTVDEIEQFRRDVFVSFGSCSFDEPVQELTTLQLI